MLCEYLLLLKSGFFCGYCSAFIYDYDDGDVKYAEDNSAGDNNYKYDIKIMMATRMILMMMITVVVI